MRWAVISDIHGNIAALNAVLADIDARGVDEIINLGDSLSGPLDARATMDCLATLDLPTVSGNHDRLLIDRPREEMGNWETWIIDDLTATDLDWVRNLPFSLTIGDIYVCHASPRADMDNWLDDRGPKNRMIARDLAEVVKRAEGIDAGMILCGHTHTPRSVRLPDGRAIVNPGAVGCPAYLDTRSDPPFVQETGSPDARYAIIDNSTGTWRTDLLSVPYDATEMIALARAKGADNWINSLENGWTSG